MTTILIADDSKIMREYIKNSLESNSNFKVIGEVGDGKSVVKKYKELKPDLVLLDIIMPEQDGVKSLEEIMTKYPDAKCIMCSAMGQKSYIIESTKIGAKDFIVKPFKPEMLVSIVKKQAGVNDDLSS